MKSMKSLYLYLIVLLFSVTSFAYSQGTVQYFEIQKGSVTVTPGMCPVDNCIQTSAELTGTFSAEIVGDTITFSNVNVSSTPETGFVLPEVPNGDNGDSSFYSAKFDFDGTQLVVSGIIDSRAFDGPLYEYDFAAQVSEAQGFDANGFYTARQDFRKCISPICGGIFVKSVNKRLTKCADGSRQEECYVAIANWEKLGFDPFHANGDPAPYTPILLKGKLKPHIDGFGNLGEFVATAAYRQATNNPAEGIFTALINKGIVCITTPCFSIDEYVLNTRKVDAISGFDLNPVGASDEDLSIAYSLFAKKSPLIVAGYNKKQQELHGIGISFIANQLYLPIQPIKQPCIDSYTLVNGVCTAE